MKNVMSWLLSLFAMTFAINVAAVEDDEKGGGEEPAKPEVPKENSLNLGDFVKFIDETMKLPTKTAEDMKAPDPPKVESIETPEPPKVETVKKPEPPIVEGMKTPATTKVPDDGKAPVSEIEKE